MIKTLTVSEFIAQINGLVAGEFIVEGEVSQYQVSQGRWVFFSLKDEKATLNCFAALGRLRVQLTDGMKIRVTGYPNIYEKTGKFSLVAQAVELVGEGSLKRAYLLLKQKLEAEGLFAQSRKRPLPYLPQKIGVIASRDSAAFGDFKRILNNRWGGTELILRHALVQGEGAVEDIVSAFAEFNALADDDRPEALALIRGGGSLEDLAAFNSEAVARAVYGSKIPVICGVGHERDESLSDFAADVRASTPSNAVEILVPDKREFGSRLDFELNNFSESLSHRALKLRWQTDSAFSALTADFEAPLARGRALADKFFGLFSALENSRQRKNEFVLSSERLFKNVDPKRVLRRGYGIARDKSGRILRDAATVDAGDEIMIELSKGSIESRVVRTGAKKAGQAALFV